MERDLQQVFYLGNSYNINRTASRAEIKSADSSEGDSRNCLFIFAVLYFVKMYLILLLLYSAEISSLYYLFN